MEERVKAIYPDAFAKHEKGCVQGNHYDYWEIWVTPKRKWSSKVAGSGGTEDAAWENAAWRLP